MSRVASVFSNSNGDGVRVVVENDIGEKKSFVISYDDFLSLGIKRGDICDVELAELSSAADNYKAFSAAVRILSSGQCSAGMLYQKLRRRGFTHECAKNASDMARSSGYIDERWQVESYCRTLFERRCVGRKKAVPFLLKKGYSLSMINEVIDENYGDEYFMEMKKALLLKKFGKTSPDTREEYAEMKKELCKNGF